MDMTQQSCRAFVEVLSSSAPAPGGGGAAALVGAVGTALGHMSGALTVGKKKYADAQAQLTALMDECRRLQEALLDQVEADGRGFAPLVQAYAIPRDDPRREVVLEEASAAACAVPLRIMELCCQALDCMAVFAARCSRLSVSDVGCGAVLCKGALQAASLNVFINTKAMKNRTAADELNRKATGMLESHCALADIIYRDVMGKLTGCG